MEYTREVAGRTGRSSRDGDRQRKSTGVTAATLGIARILGLIIDRREVGDVGAFDGLTDEELMQEAVKRARELGIAGPRLVEDDNKKPR